MYILLASIMVLLAVNLAAVFFTAYSLKKRVLSWSGLTQERISGLSEKTHSMGVLLEALRRDLDGMECQRRKGTEELRKELCAQLDGCLSYGAETVKSFGVLWKKSEQQTAILKSLLAREDVSETVKRLEAQLREASEPLPADDESKRSKFMEEGISSILAYTAGKVPGVELRL